MIPLISDEIHLWLAFYEEIVDERLHGAYRALMNDAEKEQEQRFYFDRDRRRYLVTRALGQDRVIALRAGAAGKLGLFP
jgi:4'-phosphopantetheinyl transferase